MKRPPADDERTEFMNVPAPRTFAPFPNADRAGRGPSLAVQRASTSPSSAPANPWRDASRRRSVLDPPPAFLPKTVRPLAPSQPVKPLPPVHPAAQGGRSFVSADEVDDDFDDDGATTVAPRGSLFGPPAPSPAAASRSGSPSSPPPPVPTRSYPPARASSGRLSAPPKQPRSLPPPALRTLPPPNGSPTLASASSALATPTAMTVPATQDSSSTTGPHRAVTSPLAPDSIRGAALSVVPGSMHHAPTAGGRRNGRLVPAAWVACAAALMGLGALGGAKLSSGGTARPMETVQTAHAQAPRTVAAEPPSMAEAPSTLAPRSPTEVAATPKPLAIPAPRSAPEPAARPEAAVAQDDTTELELEGEGERAASRKAGLHTATPHTATPRTATPRVSPARTDAALARHASHSEKHAEARPAPKPAAQKAPAPKAERVAKADDETPRPTKASKKWNAQVAKEAAEAEALAEAQLAAATL